MTDATFTFTLDGRKIEARAGETVIEAAERAGIFIPHLCHRQGYAPAGQCRACMIEVEARAFRRCAIMRKDGRMTVIRHSLCSLMPASTAASACVPAATYR